MKISTLGFERQYQQTSRHIVLKGVTLGGFLHWACSDCSWNYPPIGIEDAAPAEAKTSSDRIPAQPIGPKNSN